MLIIFCEWFYLHSIWIIFLNPVCCGTDIMLLKFLYLNRIWLYILEVTICKLYLTFCPWYCYFYHEFFNQTLDQQNLSQSHCVRQSTQIKLFQNWSKCSISLHANRFGVVRVYRYQKYGNSHSIILQTFGLWKKIASAYPVVNPAFVNVL